MYYRPLKKKVPVKWTPNGKRTSGEAGVKKRTVRQALQDSIGLAHVVDAAVGGVVLGLPGPALVQEVYADPLVFEMEVCTGALCERERKSGEERIASTHGRNTEGREVSKECGF
jgi:hypothetical protein